MIELNLGTALSVLKNDPNIIIVVDTEGVIQYINRTVPGISIEGVIGRSQYDFIEPRYHDLVKETIEGVFLTGGSATYEIEGVGPDGGVSWYFTRVEPIRRDGEIVAVSLFSSDITARKRTEEALRESEQRYRALLEGAAEGILVADVQSRRFMYANPAVCRMLGYTEGELKTLGISNIHPERALGHVIAEFEAQVRGEKPVAADIPCLRKDGTVFYADVCSAPVQLDGRDCNVGFFTDITERRNAEDAARKANDELIAKQTSAIRELSAPVIQVWDEILVLPLIGPIDTNRARLIVDNLLSAVVETQSKVLIIDVRGVPVVDTSVARHLVKTVEAARLLGTYVIITGISPHNAQTMVTMGIDLSGIATMSSLHSALQSAFRRTGRTVTLEPPSTSTTT